jgi:hypothetical protein
MYEYRDILEDLFGPDHNPHFRKTDPTKTIPVHDCEWREVVMPVWGLSYEICDVCRAQRHGGDF